MSKKSPPRASGSRKRLARLCLISALCLVCSGLEAQTLSSPQTPTSAEAGCKISDSNQKIQLAGRVSDPSGAAVPGATITLKCGSFLQQVHTVGDGSYSISAPAGRYALQVEAPGLESIWQAVDLTGAPNQAQTLDFPLKLGRATSIVSVTAPAGYVAASATTATKTDTPLIETPQSVSVITLDQMSERNVQTLNEAI